jgi:hypothetical protein
MARQRVRPEVAGPMTSSGGPSSKRHGAKTDAAIAALLRDYWIVRFRGR